MYNMYMRFVWDQNKKRENVRKHGIDFRDVIDMFKQPMLVQLDARQDYGEDRWIGVGLLKDVVAVVVYVEWQDEETIRIISARKATTYEKDEYYKRISH
jgi:uncharacterized protein